jgi:hypothetical protein
VEEPPARVLRLRVREQGPPAQLPTEILLGMPASVEQAIHIGTESFFVEVQNFERQNVKRKMSMDKMSKGKCRWTKCQKENVDGQNVKR